MTHTPLTDAEIEAGLQAAEKATPGPWIWRQLGGEMVLLAEHGKRFILISGGYTRDERGVLEPMSPGQPVSDFITLARDLLPQALEEVKRLRKERGSYMGALANMQDHVQPKLDKAWGEVEKLRGERAALLEVVLAVEHAIELGYLGEGSTAGMTRDALSHPIVQAALKETK